MVCSFLRLSFRSTSTPQWNSLKSNRRTYYNKFMFGCIVTNLFIFYSLNWSFNKFYFAFWISIATEVHLKNFCCWLPEGYTLWILVTYFIFYSASYFLFHEVNELGLHLISLIRQTQILQIFNFAKWILIRES